MAVTLSDLDLQEIATLKEAERQASVLAAIARRKANRQSTETETAYVAVTGTYTVLSTDRTVNCTANTFTVTLPSASGISGKQYNIKNSGAGVITLDGNGSETIDGSTSIAILANESRSVISDDTNWIII